MTDQPAQPAPSTPSPPPPGPLPTQATATMTDQNAVSPQAESAVISAQTTPAAPEKKGIPALIVIVAILLGVTLIIVGFFAYENYQLRQTSSAHTYHTLT